MTRPSLPFLPTAPDLPIPQLPIVLPCVAVVIGPGITVPTIKGEDLWNEGTPQADGRDRIWVEDPVRKTTDVVSVDEFLSDSRFDRFGSPERRKELVGKALWKTPTGMHSGLPIASSLKGRVVELQKAYQIRETVRIRELKGVRLCPGSQNEES